MRRFGSSKVVLVATVSFLWLAVASAGHLHPGSVSGSVRSECQLCTLARAGFGVPRTVPALFGLALVGWLVLEAAVAAPSHPLHARPPARAPPVR